MLLVSNNIDMKCLCLVNNRIFKLIWHNILTLLIVCDTTWLKPWLISWFIEHRLRDGQNTPVKTSTTKDIVETVTRSLPSLPDSKLVIAKIMSWHLCTTICMSVSLTISVIIVENCHTWLGGPVELDLLPVIWLLEPHASSVGPVVEPVGGVGGGHGHLVGGPEPSVDVLGEQVRSVTPVKITQSSRGPKVSYISWKRIQI